jgi:hypothetical protein
MNKEESAAFLGVSVRTLQRYTAAGKVPCRHTQGVAMYDIETLERFKAGMTGGDGPGDTALTTMTGMTTMTEDDKENGMKVVTPVTSVTPATSAPYSARFAHFEPSIPPEIIERAAVALERIADGNRAPSPEPEIKSIVALADLRYKLMLDLDECCALTSLSKRFFYVAIKEGRLPAFDRAHKLLVKRTDLDRFIADLK